MRFLPFLLLCVLGSGSVLGQVGNEWINVGQTYYKIPVGKDGIYKVTRADLASAGVPVATIDPRRIQIFHRGQEQAISFQHQQSPANGVFDTGEFLEFYGKKNDGTLDTELYTATESQPHTLYNLYNDTAYYFLTVHPTLQGKRMATFSQVNTGALTREASSASQQTQVFTSSYSSGQTYNSFVQLTAFDLGEGWMGPLIRENNFFDITFSGLTNAVPTSGNPQLTLQLVGRGIVGHRVDILVGPSVGALRLLSSVDFFGYDAETITGELTWTDLNPSGSLVVRVNVVGTGGADFVSASYARVSYPRNFNMLGETERTLFLNESPINRSYIEVSNAPVNARVLDVTNADSPILIGTTQTATLNAVVDNTATARTLLITNQTTTPTRIKKVNFRRLDNAASFVIISNKALRKAALGSADPVLSYASYRASAVGGGYDTLVVTVDQLFNQFTYGESTPLAIHRFLRFLESVKRPSYVFIIGKGLDVSQQFYRNPNAFTEYKDYVPTAGFPASDMFYSVGLDGTENVPLIPMGRLSATRPEQIIQYLNKVKEQEAAGFSDLSRKRILHLSGGIAPGEPETFKSYMEDFASVAEGVYLGGSVAAIAKRSLASQELINISEEVNKGLGLITFFGHSSTSTTDFDIGFATDPVLGYQNKGKYPMLLINGCNAGAFFGQGVLFGEDWTNAAEKGAVGFIAHSYFGFVSNLKRYSDYFYNVAYGDSSYLKRGVGDVQVETARQYLSNTFLSAQNITQVQQMVLLGDPSVKLFGATLPDYEVNATSATVQSPNGGAVTAISPFIDVKLVIRNFGRAEEEPLVVRVERALPDNTVVMYDSTVNPLFYQDTVVIRIPNTLAQAGQGQLTITVDADNTIDELREDNNTISIDLFVPFNGTKNLYPVDFAIVNSTTPQLVFQSANLLDSLRSFEVELDTVKTFTSSWKKRYAIRSQVLVQQPIELLDRDSLTYFWRTRLTTPSSEENLGWEESSFTYILNGNSGWGQISFQQLGDNSFDGMALNQDSRLITFEERITPVLIRTFGDLNTAPVTDVSVKIDGVEYNLATQGQPCRDNTINIVAFNKTNNVPYAVIPFNFQDPRTCGREPQVLVSFTAAEIYNNGSDDLIEAIDNIAVSDSVVLFSIGNPQPQAWNAAVVSKLAEVGFSATQLASIATGGPFVIYGKKGATAGSAQLFQSGINPPAEQELVVNRPVTARNATGTMASTLVGPAQHWGQLKVKNEKLATDSVRYRIAGVTSQGNEVELMNGIVGEVDLSFIDATQYPRLALQFYAEDKIDLTPAQPIFWIVEYEPLPEGLLVYTGNTETEQLNEGEEWTRTAAFVTISEQTFADSLIVTYSSLNKISNEADEQQMKIQAPLPGDTTHFEIRGNTLHKSGSNDVTIKVNTAPVPELFYDNNLLLLKNAFAVAVDRFNPSLSVAVDGRQLVNGDFVSPNPQIEIRVWDENELILKIDTTGVRMLLQYPCSEACTPSVIYFTRADVTWMPATSTNPFTVLFNPQQLQAGLYTLQVFAEDSRGNKTGDEPYSISFVVSEMNGTNLSSVYPNPASEKINFQLTLTRETVASAVLEIVNTTGALVYQQEITTTDWYVGKNFISVDLPSEIQNGLYVYRIRLGNGSEERGQFVVSR